MDNGDAITRSSTVILALIAQNSISVLYPKELFKEKAKNFYKTSVGYLNQLDETEGFAIYNMVMMLLDTVPFWSTIEKSLIKVTKIIND